MAKPCIAGGQQRGIGDRAGDRGPEIPKAGGTRVGERGCENGLWIGACGSDPAIATGRQRSFNHLLRTSVLHSSEPRRVQGNCGENIGAYATVTVRLSGARIGDYGGVLVGEAAGEYADP